MSCRASPQFLRSVRQCAPMESFRSRCLQFRPRAGRPRNKSSHEMAFPHPKSRKEHDRKEYKPGQGSVVRNGVKWTVDITDDRNGADDVNPADDQPYHDESALPFVGDTPR